MSSAEKIGMGIIGVAFATTLVLPDRLTAKVAAVFFNGFNGALATAMGRNAKTVTA